MTRLLFHLCAQASSATGRLVASTTAAGALTVAGCTSLPPPRLAEPGVASETNANIVRLEEGRQASTTLEVLTFNIEGLGWPARRGRASQLARIGGALAQLNARGEGPDVILVQEMFSSAAVHAITRAGYRYQAWGPSRTQRRRLSVDRKMPGPARIGKGETGFHLVGSGLAVLSRFPIVFNRSEPFGTRHCAGFDCLSNKGVQHVRIAVPGVPQPIDVFNAHLNSRGASKVPFERSGAAHALQVEDVARFLDLHSDRSRPIILGGDFNMRGDAKRLARFDAALSSVTMVQRFCTVPANDCKVHMSWDGDAPWMDTEDLQLFRDGSKLALRPTRVDSMFDGSANLPQLSDHDGFSVTYRLAWPLLER